MKRRPPLRLGLVGCGRIAERGWIPAIHRVPEARLVAVADVRPERRAIAAPARGFTDARALAQSGEIEAAIVATPAAMHVDDAAALAAEGLPVLVEKPPGLDVDAARRLAALRPPVCLGFNRRFDPALRHLRSRVPPAVPLRLELGFRYRREAWAAYDVDDDVLLDVGPHVVDLARWLTGSEIRRVRALALERERCELELAFDDGLASVTCEGDAPYRETAAVWRQDGSEIGRWRRGTLGDALRSRLPRAAPPLVASLAAELRAFCTAADGDSGDLADGADGVAVMVTIEAARASASRGGDWVATTSTCGPTR